jgi:hypothetical protein|tara:strand:- start:4484 stop:4762 length:279 start_codon:yes stop_codon:yes gene_type:complete
MNFDYDKINNHLNNSTNTMNQISKDMLQNEREIKYKYLCSFYSKAFRSGSLWYIGESLSKYIDNKNFKTLFDKDFKLIYLYYILDNNIFPKL